MNNDPFDENHNMINKFHFFVNYMFSFYNKAFPFKLILIDGRSRNWLKLMMNINNLFYTMIGFDILGNIRINGPTYIEYNFCVLTQKIIAPKNISDVKSLRKLVNDAIYNETHKPNYVNIKKPLYSIKTTLLDNGDDVDITEVVKELQVPYDGGKCPTFGDIFDIFTQNNKKMIEICFEFYEDFFAEKIFLERKYENSNLMAKKTRESVEKIKICDIFDIFADTVDGLIVKIPESENFLKISRGPGKTLKYNYYF